MGRQKKNELDSVLEQLKLSYAADNDNDIEDSLLEEEDSDEDKELSIILEKIFSETATKEDDAIEDNSLQDHVLMSDVSIEHENEKKEIDTSQDSMIPESVEELFDDQAVETEEERVDDVLKKMLGITHTQTNDECIKEELENDKDSQLIENEETESSGNVLTIEDEPLIDLGVYEAVVLDEYTEPSVLIQSGENGNFFEEQEMISDDEIPEILPTVITDEIDYICDPLQQTICDMDFYKPQSECDFSGYETTGSNDSDEPDEAHSVEDNQNEITDKDIMLLMKFEYDTEIATNGENNHANKVIFNEGKKYIPDKCKIKHGFTGKEYTERDQIPEIKRKYKSDSNSIFVIAVIATFFAVIAVFSDVISVITPEYNALFLQIYLLLTLIICLILYKKIWYGFISLLKNNGNEYSLLSVILIESFIFLVLLNIINLIQKNAHGYILIFGYVFIYTAFNLWSEWLDCRREMNVFSFISDERYQYVAEKRSYSIHSSSNSNKSSAKYIIKRSRLISGYHQKTIESKKATVNILFTVGITPVVAILFGFYNSFLNKNIIAGINIASFILYLSVPLSSVIAVSIIEYINYVNLKKKNTVFVGTNYSETISNTDTLIIEDRDAIEIVSCTEIKPDSNGSKNRKWINIARNVFFSLGGPISNIMPVDKNSDSNISHDITINSISDNGIDIYFDSSINILIGDRQYMHSHNIKVKTDVNLTGATKGPDRSVIYMAFDRVPGIAFILSGKTKNSFNETIELLKQSCINVEVMTYEPEINEYFFELNGMEHPITVVKPSSFERTTDFDISNSNIVSLSPLELCCSITYSKIAANDQNKQRKIHIIQSLIGILVSCVLAIFFCVFNEYEFTGYIQRHMPILIYIVSILMLIPNILQIVSIIRRK